MVSFITQFSSKLIKNLTLFWIMASFAMESPFINYEKGHLTLSDKTVIKIILAKDEQQKTKGLSNIKESDFDKDLGMLFIYKMEDTRQFWMPNTYFNLDIFFLDKNFKVIAIERNMKAYKGNSPYSKVPKTKKYRCTYVLEMRSDSNAAKKIKKGDLLKVN